MHSPNDIEDAVIVPSRSPVPLTKKPIKLSFYDALKVAMTGHKITRLSWETNLEYGEFQNENLMIVLKGEAHSWTVCVNDITATDWIALPVQN
jgi:hypothetical protein